MALVNNIERMVEAAKGKTNYLKHNEILLNIYEGDLLTYVCEDLQRCFSERAYSQLISRVAPVNILIKIIDKLSKIYQQNPIRYVSRGTSSDNELLSWYEREMRVNAKLNSANEFYNLFKNCLIQPYIHNLCPQLRIIPSDRYVVMSDDLVDPMNPTAIVLIHGVEKHADGQMTVVYHAYTDSEFLIFNSKREILRDKMMEANNPDGINPYGKLPFVYVNKSENMLMPVQDSDTLKMTKLIPILLTDLNYAVMYQSFSITYGININNAELEKNPDAFWSFKSEDAEHKPEIGVIKPQVDIAEVLNLIQSELALWLNSKGIRPGAVGQLQGDSFASGISKMIDEMDTFEDRQEQANVFKTAEKHMWDLILNYMHPVWVSNGLIENRTIFTASAEVEVDFHEQKPMISRGELVKEVKEEVSSGFLTRKDAIKRLNPEMSDEEVLIYMAEIDEEKTITVPELPQDVLNEVVNGESTKTNTDSGTPEGN